MERDAVQGFLRIGVFLAFSGLCSAFFQPRDSGEFVVSVCSAAIGLTLIAGIIIIFRYMK